jgi:carboxymethylenebutenolidase
MEKVEIKTIDGRANCYAFYPEGEGNWPAIIFYMDAFGIRGSLFDMAERLALRGYYVLLPDLYYRGGAHSPFNPETAFSEEAERERLMKLMKSVTMSNTFMDTMAFLEFLSMQKKVKGLKTGCVGYCMGGKFALRAAGNFPGRIASAASIHGGSLATDGTDSPHLLATNIKAKIYIAVAEIDKGFTNEQKEKLEAALEAAKVDYTLEVYVAVAHGFAVNDSPVYDVDAAETHWRRLFELFEETL